jgi:hypothetical protein
LQPCGDNAAQNAAAITAALMQQFGDNSLLAMHFLQL